MGSNKLFTESWVHGHGALGVGCRLWRLPPSWFQDDWSEVAEVVAVERWFQSLMVRGKKELNSDDWCVPGVDAPLILGSACKQRSW